MNKKGQVLVMFVLLLPVLFLGIYFIYLKIDLYLEKKEQTRIIEKLCDYYEKDKDIDKILELGTKEDRTQTIEINKLDNNLEITLYKEKELLNINNKIKTVKECKKG